MFCCVWTSHSPWDCATIASNSIGCVAPLNVNSPELLAFGGHLKDVTVTLCHSLIRVLLYWVSKFAN